MIRTHLALLALAGVLACAREPAAPRRPRLVALVVLECVRADHTGVGGYAHPTTPNLDALAREGVCFERAHAASSASAQSLSALWTGGCPSRCGSVGLDAAPHPALDTLPRLLRRAGYRTGLASNHPELRARGFTRAFDELEIDCERGRWDGERVTAKALDIVDQAAGAPLFLAVDYADAAEPHLPPEKFRRGIGVPGPDEVLSLPMLRSRAGSLPAELEHSAGFLDLVARYDAEIAYVDDCLGRLIDGLRERGLLEDALIVVTASHGNELLEHGFAGSGWTLYDEVLRVPLVVYAPGRLAPARVLDPVSLVDVLPSLRLALALGAGERELDGESLLSIGEGRLAPRTRERPVIAELVLPERGILRASIAGSWKLVEAVQWTPPEARADLLADLGSGSAREPTHTDPWGPPVRIELYDLADDPREVRDRAPTLPERVAELRDALARYARACRTSGLAGADPEGRFEFVEAEGADELQQLGYL